MNYKLTYKRGKKKMSVVFAPPKGEPVTVNELKGWFRKVIGVSVKNGFYPRKVSMPCGDNKVYILYSLALTDAPVDDAQKRTIAQVLGDFSVQSLGGW